MYCNQSCKSNFNRHNIYVPWSDYIISSNATKDIGNLVVLLFRYFGPFGNAVFFICSAWFLIDNDNVSFRRIIKMILDIWVISVVICTVAYIVMNGGLNTKLLIKQVFPITFGNNWYMTCYLLFYPIHGLLNKLLIRLEQRELLLLTTVLLFLYVICYFFKPGLYYTNPLILNAYIVCQTPMW